jgi:hypothetical protein
MKSYLSIVILLLSGVAFAGGPVQGDKTENGNGPLQDHTCQGGHNCNSGGSGGGDATAGAIAGAEANSTAVSTSLSSASVANINQVSNDSSSTAYGGDARASAQGGSAEQQQGQSQNQYIEDSGNSSSFSGVSNSGNSSNYNSQSQSNSGNNASQSTSLNFESTGNARHYNKYGNNVSAYAPAIYSSSACTAGGLSGGVSGFGAGVSLGGAKQDPQCQVRENARILASLDASLALMYLCANLTVDVGKVLGSACKPADPIIVLPPQPEPPKPEVKPEIPVIDDKVKG